MSVELGFILLFVANPHTSAEFYRKILGKEPVEQSPTFTMFVLSNGVKLGLWSRATAEPLVKGAPGSSEIAFVVDDVDATYEQWGKLGIQVEQKPTDMDFGRTCVVVDPDGHRIRVCRMYENR